VKFVDFGGKRQNNEQYNYEQYIPKSFVKHHRIDYLICKKLLIDVV
jgi:hypothetical protein